VVAMLQYGLLDCAGVYFCGMGEQGEYSFHTRWNGWDPSSRLLITRSTHTESGPAVIVNWFLSHFVRGNVVSGAGGCCCGFQVVWLI
jgi:hypothetical protein